MTKKQKVQKPTKAQLRWKELFQNKLKNGKTVGELITALKAYPDDMKVYFSGLDFYRLKQRGSFLQVEFNQPVYLNKKCKIVIEEISEE